MPEPNEKPEKKSNQVVGNTGLFYVCYRLSRLGWNVMPTSRNARGVDVLAYNEKATAKLAIQVKTLSKKDPVPLGQTLDSLFGDFFVICCKAMEEPPTCFVLTPKEVQELAHRGERDGRVSYWLQPPEYDKDEYRNAWQRLPEFT